MSGPVHIFVCQPGTAGMEVLAEWVFQSQEPQARGGSDPLIGTALIERLSKHLRTENHPACRVADPIREPSAAVRPSKDLLESTAVEETEQAKGEGDA